VANQVLASDVFIRGAYPVNLGANSDGWTTVIGASPLKVASAGIVESTATGVNNAALYTGLSWPNDQYSEITLGTVPPGTCQTTLIVRSDASLNNCYLVEASGITLKLYVYNGGTPTGLFAYVGVIYTQGDVIRLSVNGSSVVVTQNGTALISVSDTTVVSGSPGILISCPVSITQATITSWNGGTARV
jgi:hypothetical protein